MNRNKASAAGSSSTVPPTSWTLLFKQNNLTILLFVTSLTPFATIKADLLEVLQDRYPDLPSLPDAADEIRFAVLDDATVKDSKESVWVELDTGDGEGRKENPLGLGLKDGSILAFAFGKGKFEVLWSSYEEDEVMEGSE